MKLTDLLEASDAELEAAKQWYVSHSHHHESDFFTSGGELCYKGQRLVLDCKEIKYPIRLDHPMADLIFTNETYKLGSVKNFPLVSGHIDAGGHAIKVIDHPIRCGARLNMAMNKLASLKDIHKYVSCRKITVWNNPVKRSILGLLLIPGIRTIDDGTNGALEKKFSTFHNALEIVAKHVGAGRAGVLDAQQELLDAGLDDYAEI